MIKLQAKENYITSKICLLGESLKSGYVLVDMEREMSSMCLQKIDKYKNVAVRITVLSCQSCFLHMLENFLFMYFLRYIHIHGTPHRTCLAFELKVFWSSS